MSLTDDEFDACFDRARSSVFRLETLQRYTVAEETPRIEAFRRGEPRPDRSVRTSPWMRRIAVTTAAGVHWSRVHLVELPLSEYLRYQMQGYIESAAVGEEIRMAVLEGRPGGLDAAVGVGDFWLFDDGTPTAQAVALRYDEAGRPAGEELVVDPVRLHRYSEARAAAWAAAMPLNRFLAGRCQQAVRA